MSTGPVVSGTVPGNYWCRPTEPRRQLMLVKRNAGLHWYGCLVDTATQRTLPLLLLLPQRSSNFQLQGSHSSWNKKFKHYSRNFHDLNCVFKRSKLSAFWEQQRDVLQAWQTADRLTSSTYSGFTAHNLLHIKHTRSKLVVRNYC